ncbi:MAG: LysM peptidoglycan-binding domain-containing protein [Chloroflexaceae bacterium]|nr:LysM peptidoglycan-binding domain-containing protein [Chloroflexaceae bacterium]
MLITPAPTLDIDATATAYALQLRPTPTPAGLYIVRDGDTLSDLADRYHTTVEEIMVLNELSDPDELVVGQNLLIPSLMQTPTIETPVSVVSITPVSVLSATGTSELTGTTGLTVPLETLPEATDALTPAVREMVNGRENNQP